MPNLMSYSILDNRVKKYQTDYGIETLGAAFEWVVLETILGLNTDEMDDAIVDDGNDGGIDAICVMDNDVHIFTCTYALTFDNARKNFPQGKLDNLALTVQKILTKDIKETDVNTALWEKTKVIWALLKSGTPTFHFYICSNKLKPTDAARDRFQGILKPFRYVDFKYLDLEDIVSSILRERHPQVDGEVTFFARNHFQKSDGPLKAVVATISATDLVNLITDPSNPDKINDNIFNDNVRIDLGLKNPINNGIKQSALAETNYEFWYLNNGIMVVCDECMYVPNTTSPKAKLINVQIVNGGQTSRTLFHAYKEDPEKVGHVDILLRIVETKDKSISERISETANKQTPVKTRDLHANDWIQRKLEEDFLNLGYFYERKKNQHYDQPTDKRLDAELLAQLAMAYYLDMPSEARNAKSVVFGEQYSEIFNQDSMTASKLLFPWLLYRPLELQKREIQSRKRKKVAVPESEAFISLATFHIIYAMKLIAEHEKSNLKKPRQRQAARDKAIKTLFELVTKEMGKRGEVYTHASYFKEKTTNKAVYDAVHACYDQPMSRQV